MTALQELIARLEKATEGSRELDAEIAVVSGEFLHGKVSKTRPWLVTQAGINREPPRYSASIDAALTLVPEDFQWLVRDDERGGFCNVTSPDFVAIEGSNGQDESIGKRFPTYAATPALALCIAALRARAA